jgi:hypothetical protein
VIGAGNPRLEPDTVADSDDGHCLHSMAISLKHIADVLDESLRTGHADGRTLHDLVSGIEMNGRSR